MSEHSPLVSVVMPVYNAGAFLKQAIDSILTQTYPHFELVLINDGSTDDSEQIVQSYNDPRIRYHYQSNRGVAKTLNRGIELAIGEYIWRHDADDISLPNKLESEISFLLNHPDVVLCACQVAFMTESGKPAWKFRQPKTPVFQGRAYLNVQREHFNPYSPITHGTVLVKTSVMRQLGGYREAFITSEDIDMWLRIIEHHKAVVLADCLSLHRLSKGSATKKHGWKNKFYKELAFKYYEQRMAGQPDDLQKGLEIKAVPPPEIHETQAKPGKNYRADLLMFTYPLHLNAKDWAGVRQILWQAIKDGWQKKQTWKMMLYHIVRPKK